MKKILLASGCSMTDSNYVSETNPEIDCSWPKWPELIAKKLDMECINLGRNGAGNEYIYSSLLEKILEKKDQIGLVMVGWTQCQRKDYQEWNIWKEKRFDPERLHFEDELFFEELRNKYTEGKIESIIIHNEAFELYPNLRKARIAQKQSKSHKIRSSFRLNIKTIIIETPVLLLPGVIFILALRTIAKRILPVESGTSR